MESFRFGSESILKNGKNLLLAERTYVSDVNRPFMNVTKRGREERAIASEFIAQTPGRIGRGNSGRRSHLGTKLGHGSG
jgi:hypothetical protein